jgi:hypothetical protein
MAHLILAIDANTPSHDKIPDWLHRNFSYTYTNEKTKETYSTTPIVREIRLYEVVIKRNAIGDFLKDLSLWQKITMLSGANFTKFYSLIKRFIPFEIPQLKDARAYWTEEECSKRRDEKWNMQKMGGPIYIHPIGILPDMINEDGEDML